MHLPQAAGRSWGRRRASGAGGPGACIGGGVGTRGRVQALRLQVAGAAGGGACCSWWRGGAGGAHLSQGGAGDGLLLEAGK
jgi:hypothetical protein